MCNSNMATLPHGNPPSDSPLAAIQMLWINLVMDSLASLSLATETPSDDVLDQPPYATDASLVCRYVKCKHV